MNWNRFFNLSQNFFLDQRRYYYVNAEVSSFITFIFIFERVFSNIQGLLYIFQSMWCPRTTSLNRKFTSGGVYDKMLVKWTHSICLLKAKSSIFFIYCLNSFRIFTSAGIPWKLHSQHIWCSSDWYQQIISFLQSENVFWLVLSNGLVC